MSNSNETVTPAEGLPPELRFLKALVIGLTSVMIIGFLIIVALLVVRLTADPLPLPDLVTLPEGASATAYTEGPDWVAVVTDQNEILIFNRTTGALRQTIAVETE